MNFDQSAEKITYSIMDPTGNITALVESPVPVELQPGIAERIMKEKPTVEQVGFVNFTAGRPALRMAGGEFCGNASMSAAVLYALQNRITVKSVISMCVSGTADPVDVRVAPAGDDVFDTGVKMPPALSFEEVFLSLDEWKGTLPLVRMQGIFHLIVRPSSSFYSRLSDNPAVGEQALRLWAQELSADGLGIMILTPSADPAEWDLEPLVYIPGSGTFFREHSCASGTASVGMYLSYLAGTPLRLVFHEPGGILKVVTGPENCETWLSGRTRFLERCTLSQTPVP